MNTENICQYLELSDSWTLWKQSCLMENLVLATEFKTMMDSCELRPLYNLNLIDFFNPKEPVTSRMLEQIFSYSSKKEGYVVLRNFCERFLAPCGFDCRKISEPEIIAERNGHIDLRITEENKYAIIVENKLKGADFQRNQIARYIQKIKDEGYDNNQIYIVILPQQRNVIINPSVWRLPPDYRSSTNVERKCGIYDDKLCWCDFPERKQTDYESKHCSKCVKEWEKEFSNHTRILHQDFAKWLIETESVLPSRELNVRSAILQFADYLNGLYNTRTDQKLNKMITDFLRDKLNLTTSASDFRKLNRKIEEIEELEDGLKALRLEISSELIDLWHDRLLKKWPMLRNEPGKSFGILIQGMWFGCWWAEEADNKDYPIWGIKCAEDNPSERQVGIAREIISKSGLAYTVSDDQWMAYDNTTKGDVIAGRLYNAAAESGYLE